MAKKPASFTFANTTESLTVVPSDTVNFVDDVTNNPDSWDYFFAYTTSATTMTVIDSKNAVRVLTTIPAFTVIPFPIRRINATSFSGSVLALIPNRY